MISPSSKRELDLEETMPIPGRIASNESQNPRIAENKCKEKGHKKCDLMYVCTAIGCDHILLCKRCKKKHLEAHQDRIKPLDDWFNRMFGRRAVDNDNNKVSRKCGMNLGKLQEQLKGLQKETQSRRIMIGEQTEKFIAKVTAYIRGKEAESISRLESHYQTKCAVLEEQNATYKKLKSMNRFTILENLKRQHDPNGVEPPKIPIDSIVRFLIANEEQLSDSQEIDNQHKAFSKLVRDTESLEQNIINETKELSKLATTEEGQADYLIKDSPITQRIEDYIDFLYAFEKGLPKKPASFFRSGTLSMEDEDINSANSQQHRASSVLITPSRHFSQSTEAQVSSSSQNIPYNQRRRFTIEEVLQHSTQQASAQQIMFNPQQSQTNILRQLQDQDKGEFLMMKRRQRAAQEQEDEDKEELDYQCEVQENFNSAQFVDFNKDSIRVFGDTQIVLYSLHGNSFSKTSNFRAKQQVLVRDEEMYEVGAIEEVDFFPADFSDTLESLVHEQEQDQVKEKTTNRKDSVLASPKTNSNNMTSSSSSSSSSSPSDSPKHNAVKKLPLLIIGLKSDPAKIEVWDMNKNQKVCEQPSAHDCSITCVKLLQVVQKKSVLFAVGSYDGLIKIWLLQCSVATQESQIQQESDHPNGNKASTLESYSYSLTAQMSLKAHTDFVTSMILLQIKDDPQKNYLISSGSDKRIIMWDWKENKSQKEGTIGEQEHNNSSITSLKDAKSNASNEEQKQKVEDSQSPSQIEKEKPKNNELEKEVSKPKPLFLKRQIKIMSMSKPGIQQKSDNHSNTAETSNSQQSQHQPILLERKPLKIMQNVHSDKINCFEILEEGLLASGSSDNTIKIWDMDTQKEEKTLQNKFIVNSVCRLHRGQLVCSANNVKMSIYLLNIWNWEKGQIIGVIKGHAGRITKLHVLSGGRIVTCERNKVIRIWKDHFKREDDTINGCLEEDGLSCCSPTSIRSHFNRGTLNPAEEFFHNYQIELDPSLTPKYINMARIASSTTIIPSYDKTPISNLISAPGFTSLMQTQQQQNFFLQEQEQLIQPQYSPATPPFPLSYISPPNKSLKSANHRPSIEEHFTEMFMNIPAGQMSSTTSPRLQHAFMSTLNAQLAVQALQQQQLQQQQQQQQPSQLQQLQQIEKTNENQTNLRKRVYQESPNMLAPLEEANESCYNSPMGSYNEVNQDTAALANNLTNLNTNSYSSAWKNVSLENIDKTEGCEIEKSDSDKSQSSCSSSSSESINSPVTSNSSQNDLVQQQQEQSLVEPTPVTIVISSPTPSTIPENTQLQLKSPLKQEQKSNVSPFLRSQPSLRKNQLFSVTVNGQLQEEQQKTEPLFKIKPSPISDSLDASSQKHENIIRIPNNHIDEEKKEDENSQKDHVNMNEGDKQINDQQKSHDISTTSDSSTNSQQQESLPKPKGNLGMLKSKKASRNIFQN